MVGPHSNWMIPHGSKPVFQRYQPQVLLYCHAVCDVTKCQNNPEWAYQINVGHVQRVMNALPSTTRLVYVSSDHVFGQDGVYRSLLPPAPLVFMGRQGWQPNVSFWLEVIR